MRSLRFLLPILVAVLAACSAQTTQTAAPQAEPVSAGMARLIFTRPADHPYGMMVPATIEVNGKEAAAVPFGESRSITVAPGTTTIAATMWGAPGRHSVTVEAEAGREYRFLLVPRSEQYVAGLVGGIVGQAIEGGGPFRITAAGSP